MHIYHLLVQYGVFRQGHWGASCKARRGLSNALVQSHVRLTDVDEIWAFPFGNALAPVAA